MWSRAAVWQAAGVTPDAVVGHSQGEIAAAVVAGVLSLADGAKVVALRSQALAQLAGTGGMVSVAEPVGAVQHRLGAWDGRVHIAAVNGPRQVVVSGDAQALDELAAAWEGDGGRARRVEVDYASHSPLVEPIQAQVLDALAGVAAAPGTVAVVSGIDGPGGDGAGMDDGYWYRSLREPVQFHQAVQTLAASGHRIFIEVSPHPVLTPAIEDTLTSTGAGADSGRVVVTGTLRRDDGGLDRLAASLAQVWVAGGGVDWSRWFAGAACRRVDLPTYAFQREHYWLDMVPARAGDPEELGQAAARHPLLGAAVELPASGAVVLTGRLSLATHPWLADHVVAGRVLVPGAAFADLVVRAGDEAGCGVVEELVLETPLVIPGHGGGADGNGVRGQHAGVRIQVMVGSPDESGRRSVEVFSRPEDAPVAERPWLRHATGVLAPGTYTPPIPPASADRAAWPPPDAEAVDVTGFYDGLPERGVQYGPSFRGLVAAWRRGEEVFAEVSLPEGVLVDGYGLHPVLLDAALQAMALGSFADFDDGEGPWLPFAWSGMALHAAGATTLRVRIASNGSDAVCVQAADGTGAPVVSIGSLTVRALPGGQLGNRDTAAGEGLWRVEWEPAAAAGPAEDALVWAVAGDECGLGMAGARAFGDLAGVGAAVGAGGWVPDVVVVCCRAGRVAVAGGGEDSEGPEVDGAGAARAGVVWALGVVQAWLGDERLAGADMGIHGWRLFNCPERMSYSATPPDFGSLCIQRRRWANGGLLIRPKLRRQSRARRAQGQRTRFSELFLRWNYMASISWSSTSLLVLLAFPFSAALISPLLGLVALPYFLAMASDLRYCGYKRLDVLRIYGFNLVLLPVNLAGTISSVIQGITASKAPFARTPKVRNRTVVPAFFVIAPYLLIALAGFTFYVAYRHDRVENMNYAALNIILACYAVKAFIGLRNSVVDVCIHGLSLLD